MERLNILMGIIKDMTAFDKIATSRYGLGECRTLQDAVEFSVFDPVKRKMTKNTCGNLAWVPYTEVEHYGLDKNLRQPLWNEAGGSKVKATKPSEESSRKEKDAWKIKSWAGSGSVERKLFLAEVAVKNEKAGILLLLSVVVFAAIGKCGQTEDLCSVQTNKKREAGCLIVCSSKRMELRVNYKLNFVHRSRQKS